jgi:HemY protein
VILRVIIFLAIAALLALGAAWIADRPGDVSITWLGWHIDTSVTVAAVALVLVVAFAMLLWSALRTLYRSPRRFASLILHRRLMRGERAISRGLIAIAAGDLRTARKFAAEALRYKSGEPLALLLGAQTAQLAGDRAAAEVAFRAMAERDDTKQLGLRGLYVEARRRNDMSAARGYAEEAARAAPALGWAGQAALEFRCAAGDWDGALAALERNMKNKQIDKPLYRRQRAVLLTAAALQAEESDRDRARTLALDAVKLAPALVPAAELAGRMLAEARKFRKAGRIIERAWQANPHPALAHVYAYLRMGDSARDRLVRVQALAEQAPGHVEGAIAVARAAIGAQEFTVARNVLTPLLAAPTQRVAELMAELEYAENGDEGRAREWMASALRAPRDPVWTADGFVSERWLPVSPVDGRLDALQWQVPHLALAAGGAMIEDDHPLTDVERPQEIPAVLTAPDRTEEPAATAAAARSGRRNARPASTEPKFEGRAQHSVKQRLDRVEPVIPLVHAPDDPGPEPSAVGPSGPEPLATPWWRIWLFK